jgi:2-dehydro-3-deoxyphosphooctonate aldolase (KDO 8-P synthase)
MKIGGGIVQEVSMGNDLPFVLIAGPCQIESLSHALRMAETLANIALVANVPFIYKSSYDKANRSDVGGIRGPGLVEGCGILSKVRERIGCPVITDVHTVQEAEYVSNVVDMLQIPALLCRQTDLLLAAGKTNKPVNIKRGQFMAPWQMRSAVDKVSSTQRPEPHGARVSLTERGFAFGYGDLVVDYRAFKIMKDHTGMPVIFDATHSVQKPGARGQASGGQREFVYDLTQAAVAVGVAGLFLECHGDPASAPSDGDCMITPKHLKLILERAVVIDLLAKEGL